MVIESQYENSSNCSSEENGCHITTTMCHVLGYSDHCYVLTEMRNFRNNIMQKNSKYFGALLECDMIEPMIAEDIEREYEKTQNRDMWTRFYQLYLSQVVNLSASHLYEDAIYKYQQMVEVLKNYFGIQDIDSAIHQNGHAQFKKNISN